jgi:Periplasmic binding protein domain
LLSDEQWQPAEPLLCGKLFAMSCRYRLGAVPPVRRFESRFLFVVADRARITRPLASRAPGGGMRGEGVDAAGAEVGIAARRAQVDQAADRRPGHDDLRLLHLHQPQGGPAPGRALEWPAARRGTIAEEQYIDLRADRARFKSVIREVARAQPDIVFSIVVGEATAHLYQAYCEAGLNPATMPLASLTTTESEIRLMGAEVGCGHYTSAPYFERVDTGENASFVPRYKKRFGADEPTNMCVEAAYFQIHVFARALAEIDAMNTDLMRMLVLGSEFDAPQGVISIDPETNHTQLWTRIGRAGRDGQFEIVLETRGPSKPDPYLICAR